MIHANELRIGNYVYIRGTKANIPIWKISEKKINKDLTPYALEPIPLTEEWLFRFGIYPDEDGDYLIAEVYFSFNIGILSVSDDYYYGFLPKIQSVHQLQNLYFALTGEELKLNDK